MAEEQQALKEQKALVDFDGTGGEAQFEKVLVKEGEHLGTITRFEVQNLKKWESKDREPKILGFFKITGTEDELPYFLKPVITKAYNESVSNSKLYDFIVVAGLLEEAKSKTEELGTVDGQAAFLNKNFVGKPVRFSAKTVNKGKKEKQ